MISARLVMIWFDRELLDTLEKVNIPVTLYKRYVDDGNFKLSAIEEGLIWNNDTNALIKDPSSTVSLASPGGCSEWYNSVF